MSAVCNVVCAIDNSEDSENAFTWYVQNVHKEGNQMFLVHCVEPINVIGEVPSVQLYESMVDETNQKARKLEEKYKKLMTESKVTGKILARYGSNPGKLVVETASEEEARLIVCGSRGLGQFRRTIMGSVSDYILHHAHCPVIVCKHNSTKLTQA